MTSGGHHHLEHPVPLVSGNIQTGDVDRDPGSVVSSLLSVLHSSGPPSRLGRRLGLLYRLDVFPSVGSHVSGGVTRVSPLRLPPPRPLPLGTVVPLGLQRLLRSVDTGVPRAGSSGGECRLCYTRTLVEIK